MRRGLDDYIGERSASEILRLRDEVLDQLGLFLLYIHRSIAEEERVLCGPQEERFEPINQK